MNKCSEYKSIAEAKARIEEIKQLVTPLVKEAEQLQHLIITMNDCNYQNSTVNQPDYY